MQRGQNEQMGENAFPSSCPHMVLLTLSSDRDSVLAYQEKSGRLKPASLGVRKLHAGLRQMRRELDPV